MKVSIITINYNDARGLKRTIESVANQTSKEYEYIIIDGGSTDGSVDIIKQFSDCITYWVSEKDNGIYNAMNKGISVAKGDYCIFMNSGDAFYSKSVLSEVNNQLNGIDIIVGNVYVPVVKRWWEQRKQLTLLDFYKYSINHQGAFIKTEILKKTYYDEKYKICSDWKFFIEAIVIRNCSYKTISTKIAFFGVYGVGISRESQAVAISEKKMILEELFPPSILKDMELVYHWHRLLIMIYPFRQNRFFKLIIYGTAKFFGLITYKKTKT